jgi:hypothetical protein
LTSPQPIANERREVEFRALVRYHRQINAVPTALTGTTTLDALGGLVQADATGGAFTVTLPDVNQAHAGLTISIVKVDSSGNIVTIEGNGSDLVASAANQTLELQAECLSLRWTGTEWWAI